MSAQRGRNEVRANLQASMHSLMEEKSNPALLAALRQTFPDLHAAYVVHWIPEQGEEIYWVLVDRETIAVVEIVRKDPSPPPLVERMSVRELQKQRPAVETRRKLEAALQLLAEREVIEGKDSDSE